MLGKEHPQDVRGVPKRVVGIVSPRGAEGGPLRMPTWTATLDIFDEVTRLARSIRRRAWPHMTKPLARLAREIIVQRSRGRPPSTRRMKSSTEARSHGRGAPVLLNRPLGVKARLDACHVLGDVRGRRDRETLIGWQPSLDG